MKETTFFQSNEKHIFSNQFFLTPKTQTYSKSYLLEKINDININFGFQNPNRTVKMCNSNSQD